MGKIKKRAGFTLIEVIVALGIFLILILALVGNYYSYYKSVKQTAYKAIGQNIAEFQLEYVRYLPVGILSSLCGEGGDTQYPSSLSWQYYKPSADLTYYDSRVTKVEEEAAHIQDGIPFPTDSNPSPFIYDSNKLDGSFRLEKLVKILGVQNTIGSPSSPTPSLPSSMDLPSSVLITPVAEYDSSTGIFTGYDYTIILNKEVFPNYQKQIVITDETPLILEAKNKIFKIEVTVYWTAAGITKSITLTTEKSAMQ
jgi:prepilin-type N-terminal cleavage/methylation domain-containing protein